MAEVTTGKKANSFIARFRGHEVIDGASNPDLAVTVGNIGYMGTGLATMVILKKTALKKTKFGQFSIFKGIKKTVAQVKKDAAFDAESAFNA